jgi:peptide chain release factor
LKALFALKGRCGKNIPSPLSQEYFLETIWLSISAGSGPEECAHVAALTLKVLLREAEACPEDEIQASVIDAETSREKGNLRSVLLTLEGKEALRFSSSWAGVIRWIWKSEYRPHHKRKNWFVSVTPLKVPGEGEAFSLTEVRFETARASGPGGQYVNKTETAVRAVHIPSGKSTVAREERSQLLNKRLALARLAALFEDEQVERERNRKSKLRHTHYELERGNPIRVYDGKTLKLLRSIER